MKIKIISTGNVIIADEQFAQEHYPNDWEIEPDVQVSTPSPVWEWYIDIGPFMDRFGGQKLPILASADATVQAVVKDMLARKWIDLQRTDVGQVLDLLLAKGFAIDKTVILTTPVSDVENLALRKLYFS